MRVIAEWNGRPKIDVPAQNPPRKSSKLVPSAPQMNYLPRIRGAFFMPGYVKERSELYE